VRYDFGSPDSHLGLAKLHESLGEPDFNIFFHTRLLIMSSTIERKPLVTETCSLVVVNLRLDVYGIGLGSCWIGVSQLSSIA
jgi:nitroreductase